MHHGLLSFALSESQLFLDCQYDLFDDAIEGKDSFVGICSRRSAIFADIDCFIRRKAERNCRIEASVCYFFVVDEEFERAALPVTSTIVSEVQVQGNWSLRQRVLSLNGCVLCLEVVTVKVGLPSLT